MPFKSDEQRKAAFARMRGATGGRRPTGPRPPRAPSPPKIPRGASVDIIMQIIGDWLLSGGDSNGAWAPLANGEGIAGREAGPVALTGGAIYAGANSQWYLHQAAEQNPLWGNLPAQGIAPNYGPSYPAFVPAQSIIGYLYLALQGIDPVSGQTYAPTGTLSPKASTPLASDLMHERMATQYGPTAGQYTAFKGGKPPGGPTTRTNEPRPWWAP